MKNKIKYTDEPMGKLKIIKDFLPKPEELALKEENIKITISLPHADVGKRHDAVLAVARKCLIHISMFFVTICGMVEFLQPHLN